MVKKDIIYTKECRAKSLPEEQFPHKYMKYIQGDNLEKIISYVYRNDKATHSTDAGREAHKLLNRNYVFKQLNITIPYTDKRMIFYYVLDELKGKIDLQGNTETQKFQSMESGVINEYIKKLHNTMKSIDPIKYSYWGFTQEYLEISSKSKVGFYLPEIDSETNKIKRSILSEENIKKGENVPFYLLCGEKVSIIEPVGEEMIKRGYNIGYYIIDLGGNPDTEYNKMIIKLSKIKNVHILALHDGDLDGFEILFDQSKHNEVISVGVNPEFLEYSNIKKEDVRVEYAKEKEREKSYEGAKTMLKKVKARGKIDDILYQKYENWIEFSYNNKIELNSIVKRREEEDMYQCTVRDFCDYIEHIIAENRWNLLRIGEIKPTDTFSYRESETRQRSDGTWSQTISLSPKTVTYTIESKLDRITTHKPSFIGDFYRNKEESIITENKELDDIVDEIIELIYQCRDIDSKLQDIQEEENLYLEKRKEGILEDFEKENPEIFDIDWDGLHNKEKMERLNKQVEKHEKMMRIKNTLKYMEAKKNLKNYMGSIKENKPKQAILEKKIELAKYIETQMEMRKKRVNVYDTIIRDKLKETEEYENAEELVNEFEEFTDSIEEISDEKIQRLKELKERIENELKEWNNILEALMKNEDE